jgi:hypothetical protein
LYFNKKYWRKRKVVSCINCSTVKQLNLVLKV